MLHTFLRLDKVFVLTNACTYIAMYIQVSCSGGNKETFIRNILDLNTSIKFISQVSKRKTENKSTRLAHYRPVKEVMNSI